MGNLKSLLVQFDRQFERHSYPIYIGRNLFSDALLLNRHVQGRQVLLVTNETIAPLYLSMVQQAFSSIQCNVVMLPDGEAYKNERSVSLICDALIQHQHHRDTTLLALGGGVIGDITGFVASIYQRGVRWIQLPTTLLAQVDASVGGKTAINCGHAKNMIGSFYQPHAVIMDINTLSTLPLREFRSGFGEMIKYSILVGGAFYDNLHWFLKTYDCKASCDAASSSAVTEMLEHLIWQCCAIKADVVQKDERDMGCRMLLNLGHTFAHALESYTGYQRWLHGEAVAIGLYCMALLSHHMQTTDGSFVAQIDALLKYANLPRRIPTDIDLSALHAHLFHDKKTVNGALRFVLMRAFGECYVESQVSTQQLAQVLREAVVY